MIPRALLFPMLATVLVVSLSSGFVGIRYATEGATVAQVLFWRSLVSGLLLLPIVLTRAPRITLAILREQALYASSACSSTLAASPSASVSACRRALSR